MQAHEVELIRGKPTKTKDGAQRIYWHVFHHGERVGCVFITTSNAIFKRRLPAITVKLNITSRGRGIGSAVFRMASELSGHPEVHATITRHNIASRIAAIRAGFTPISDSPNQVKMVWRQSSKVTIPLIVFAKETGLDVTSAMDQLFILFPDHYPFILDETANYWSFGLKWPNDPNWFVDPHLSANAQRLFGMSLIKLAEFVQIRFYGEVSYIFSMFHSRALLAPALATQKNPELSFSSIVHVDAHNDLMSPLISVHGFSLQNALTGAGIDLDDPLSIATAIDSGVISKGNFLSAYLLGKPAGCLVRVGLDLQPKKTWLSPQEIDVPLASRTLKATYLNTEDEYKADEWAFEQMACIPEELTGSENSAVWLDVDLDAFCNRYDGDSHRRGFIETTKERSTMMTHITEFLERLALANWRTRIRAVSVAASPGFFPSEYWDAVIPAVRDGIVSILQEVRA